MLGLHAILKLISLILLLHKVLHLQFLLERLTTLVFNHFVPLWTANGGLILGIGIVVDCIGPLHIE